MQKYRCYYLNDFRDDYTASSEPDDDGEWYRVEDVDARIAELENELRIAKNAESDLRAFVHLLRPHIEAAAKAYGLSS